MSLTRAEIRTRVKTHLRAEMSTPAVNDFNDNSIDEFAQQHCADVIHILNDPSHYPSLIVIDSSLTFSSGTASLPSDYELATSVKVTTTDPAVTKRDCKLLFNPADFSKLDSFNFILTPDQDHPVVLVANGNAYVRPTSITAGYLDYVKEHPTLSATQGTVFDSIGDNVLINLILASYYGFIEEFELQANHLKLAGAI